MASEAQRNAVKKYKEKVNRITVDFHPSEAELWEHIQSQPKKQTYIKDLIRTEIERSNNMKIYTADREAGNFIEQFNSIEEAKAAIAEYEANDKREGTYEPDFYDIVDENHCSLA